MTTRFFDEVFSKKNSEWCIAYYDVPGEYWFILNPFYDKTNNYVSVCGEYGNITKEEFFRILHLCDISIRTFKCYEEGYIYENPISTDEKIFKLLEAESYFK